MKNGIVLFDVTINHYNHHHLGHLDIATYLTGVRTSVDSTEEDISEQSEVDDAKAQTDAVSKAKVTILKKFSIININYKSILNEI